MVFETVILIIAVIANLGIAMFAYTRNPRSATHRLFAALTFVIAAWSITNYLSVIVDSNPAATWLVRFVLFFSVPLGLLFLLLMHTFPRTTLSISRKKLLIIIGLMVLTMIVALSPLLFPKVTPMPGRAPQPTPGIGMILYVPVVIFGILYGIFLLIRKFIKSRGLQRIQNAYLLIGVVIMFTLIISLNFVVVNAFNSTLFIPYAPLFTLPFTGLTAYTIVRHRLMDIRAAVGRSLSFSALIGGVLLVYGALVVFVVPIIVNVTGINSNIAAVTVALISIPVAQYVRKGLSRITDRFLFQKRINYPEELAKASRELSGTINIKDVTKTIIGTTKDIIRARKTVIFLKRSGSEMFSPIASHGIKNIRVTIPESHHLIKHIVESKELIVKDELVFEKEQEISAKQAEELKKVEESLVWLDATVVLPLFVNKELSGIILLGNKKSGDPYLQDDIEFLSSFAPQAATALQNAQLYKESQEFGEKLEMEVTRATSELSVANEQLRDLDKAKSEFLSIASHQLYTPLTAIRGYLSMLNEKDYGELTEIQKPIIQILEKSANKLIALIKNLLDISRIESGKLELNLESVDLAEVVDELIMELKPNAITKRLEFKLIKPKKPLPRVVVDRMRIRQVLLNFIDNAIKYTDKGSVKVTVDLEGEELVFAVTDTGQGLTKEAIARLFNKFTRVGGEARFRTEGTGLGLYVAKQIVKEHHGEVEVTSPGLGEGSTFSMRMPIEGSPNSLKAGEKVSVEIKAAEAEGRNLTTN